MTSPKYDRAWFRDAGERVFWTFAAAGLAGINVAAFDLPEWTFVPLTTGLTAIKTYVAARLGTKGSAAILPGESTSA